MPDSSAPEGRVRFLLDVADGRAPTGHGVSPQEAVLLVSAFLAACVEDSVGRPADLMAVASLAQILGEQGDEVVPQPMVLEAVLRAGAGDGRSLPGLEVDETLYATAFAIRRLLGFAADESAYRDRMIDRALTLMTELSQVDES